ncbi:dienelactone hydrolase family protein [Solirubrobacter sp. CPCC 204708]|uniref:Dienelactone hydrolase family protein n=1 Tax=Solirubrobacter deserti TaxID=2282478 RepID=A0ABT4RJ01_9ACTN|nr:dienelactone hydrolase family protein [Solirubrobacter deserti]MBE2320904.1 dienelactone hydrolase family protein [Solirubrobacter deserti]MDA0138539.1 dienelactone hydrolase family protein [Solirubrobacter deserti]
MSIKALISGGLAVAAIVAPATSAFAQTSPYQRGPDPTVARLQATQGPFATATTSVSDLSTPGFGSANVTYPTSTTEGTFGAVAISPGYTASESSIAWLRPRLASHGFVVISFNTNSRYDQPTARGDQLLAALDWLTQSSSVRTRIDVSRLAVIGHSMGGGGTLEAAKDRPSLQAAIGLTPWNLDRSWPEIQTPTLIVGAENDSVARVSSHAIPFYTSLPGTLDKAYLELNNASHFAPNSSNTTIASTTIAWLKRFVDDDTRYTPFVCPSPTAATTGSVSDYRSTCPF